jgi:hypothetical protein
MTASRDQVLENVRTFTSNFSGFSDSMIDNYQSLNTLIAKAGISIEMLDLIKQVYSMKLKYFELQKMCFSSMKDDLEKYELEGIVDRILIKVDDAISNTLTEIEEAVSRSEQLK